VSPVTASANLVRRSVAQIADLPDVVGRARPAPGRRQDERPDLKVVPGPARRSSRRTWVVVGTVAAFAVFFGLAVFQTRLVEHQQQLDALQKQVAAAQTQHTKLAYQEAQAESPGNIVKQATALGMRPSVDRQYLPPSPEAAAAAKVAADQAQASGQDSATVDQAQAATGPSPAEANVPLADQPGVKASLGTGR
jgi:hypothetical protein